MAKPAATSLAPHEAELPLKFSPGELAALALGARMLQALGGAQSAATVGAALLRIEQALPPGARERLDIVVPYAPGSQMKQAVRDRLDALQAACVESRVVSFGYEREDGERSRRRVRPLALYLWNGVWTLAAWCEMREDFRVFRVDRMTAFRALNKPFVPRNGQQLEDFMRRMTAEIRAAGKRHPLVYSPTVD